MARGRKPKVKNESVIDFIVEMSSFTTSLVELAGYVEHGCGMSLTLPTITAYLKKELGHDGYSDMQERWRKIRSNGHC